MFAMSGANRRHVRICVNLTSCLHQELQNSTCEVFNSDMRVKVTSSGLYTYPDASIACGQIQFEDTEVDVLLNPKVIFEVLSKSTERRDRGWEFDQYCKLPSLLEYVLVSQEQALVEHFTRQPDDTWVLERVKDLDATLKLVSAGISLSLGEIYRGVEFGPEEEPSAAASPG